jgi:hypothetical protein
MIGVKVVAVKAGEEYEIGTFTQGVVFEVDQGALVVKDVASSRPIARMSRGRFWHLGAWVVRDEMAYATAFERIFVTGRDTQAGLH